MTKDIRGFLTAGIDSDFTSVYSIELYPQNSITIKAEGAAYVSQNTLNLIYDMYKNGINNQNNKLLIDTILIEGLGNTCDFDKALNLKMVFAIRATIVDSGKVLPVLSKVELPICNLFENGLIYEEDNYIIIENATLFTSSSYCNTPKSPINVNFFDK